MKPQTYGRLKRYVIQRLQQLQPQQPPTSTSQLRRFGKVQISVAREDPEKPDFGDLDVVVFLAPPPSPSPSPSPYPTTTTDIDVEAVVPILDKAKRVTIELQELKELLGAQEAISSGDVFRSFAISAAVLDAYEHEEDVKGPRGTLKNATDAMEQLQLKVSIYIIYYKRRVRY
jgi:hypothetical protein